MKIELTKEQLNRQKEFREFADDAVVPYAAQNDREERLDPELIERVKERGYLGSMLPQEYGGMGWDWVTIGLLNEEIGRGCSSLRSLLTVHGMVALALLRWGSEEQRSRWLPKMAAGEVIGAFALTEPEVGSDAKNVQSVAAASDDNYVINGRKKWITMGQIADLYLIFAKCEGKPTAFLVERGTPGFSADPITGMLGARASMLAELHLADCIIRQENMVGSVGTGLSHVALHCLDYGRYTVACGCVGLGQACLEQSVRYSRQRKQFGKALRENQLIQKMITEMAVNVKAARLLCYHAGYLKDVMDPDSIMETWTAKYFASKMVNQAASDAVQIHGANGCSHDYPVERYMRDARINEIIEGTSQMHEMLIALHTIRQMQP
ncbi:acyl-CoA dehydrogenase [Paenibacillus dendritiformis]|uniref:acyl-CoA dehydrogenase family protein n=1 Tax=Paenibacillus dendritiformis TaxID=130049 RepID=UPI001B2DB2F7|nr:acyl-CoA dehydrogenase family protein [Paenibacillus dendritiformis]GIO74180.1 acyl-CoA dehydrogenase [Paenibacillus dendritiformis]